MTFTLSGNAFYEETSGTSGVLRPGDVEWMSAGGGLWHIGGPTGVEDVSGFQLWIALGEAQENGAAHTEYLQREAIPKSGPARVLVGRYGTAVSPIENPASINYLAVDLSAGESWVYDPPAGHEVGWVAVHEGSLVANGHSVGKGELAIFEESRQSLMFQADNSTGFVLGSAVKHPHPLFLGRHSVHTSAAALRTGETGIALLGNALKEQGRLR